MQYRARVQGGVVVLEPGAALPEGSDVTVTVAERSESAPANGTSLGSRLMKYAGALNGLPSDLARNHDHYIHGTPRK